MNELNKLHLSNDLQDGLSWDDCKNLLDRVAELEAETARLRTANADLITAIEILRDFIGVLHDRVLPGYGKGVDGVYVAVRSLLSVAKEKGAT